MCRSFCDPKKYLRCNTARKRRECRNGDQDYEMLGAEQSNVRSHTLLRINSADRD